MIVSVPVIEPVWVGLNLIPMVQPPPAARPEPPITQVVLGGSIANCAETLNELMTNRTLLVIELAMLMLLALLVELTIADPKLIEAGEIPGAGG